MDITVVRTDGSQEPFNRQRIVDSLVKETALCEELFGTPPMEGSQALILAATVEAVLESNQVTEVVTSHMIRELVCSILYRYGEDFRDYYRVYTRVGMPVYDAWQIDQGSGFENHDNANLKPNAETSHKKKADKLSKEQNLLLLPPDLAALHNRGDFHIHDLEYFGTRPFCADSDLRFLFYYGLIPSGDASTSAVAGPAQNAEVAILHAVKWLGSAQTNFAGGQGFYNFLTFLSPYLVNVPYCEIKQLMQMFVYELMQMYVARGGQTVFSSVQLSPGVPKIWRDKPVVAKGKVYSNITYWDFEPYVRLAFKALMEVMIEGDADGKPFSFPKPEIAIEPCFVEPDEWVKAFDEEYSSWLPTYDELYRLSFELAAKFGTPYFDNMLPAYRGAGEGISCYQCCAYQFSSTLQEDPDFEDKLFFRGGKHFSMGSWMVITLNCPRAAYNTELAEIIPEMCVDAFVERLKALMDAAVEVFKVKKNWMDRLIASNRIPFATQRCYDKKTLDFSPPAIDLSGYVYTVGIVGLDDAIKVVTGKRMHESKASLESGLKVIQLLKAYSMHLSDMHGIKIALARTPAETTAQRFAMCDLRDRWYKTEAMRTVHGDLGYALDHLQEPDLPVYYTNGTHLPVDADIGITERLNIESKFFPVLDGGNIAHIWLGEAWANPEGLQEFAMNLAKNTPIGYFSFTKDFTVCTVCGNVDPGIQEDCCRCNSSEVDHISRITGYLSNVSGWNRAKQQELKDRLRVIL